MPLSRTAYLSATRSIQPQRRGRPVVVPTSWPTLRRCSPTSSSSSVGNGPDADAGRVGLRDPPDVGDVAWADARADAGRARDRVRGGDEGIGAVVEVEEDALRPLEEDLLAGVQRVPAELCGVGDVRLQAVAVGHVLLGHRVQIERRVLGVRAQHLPLRLHRGHDLLAQDLLVEQVLDADPKARCLVRVTGSDATSRSADLEAAELRFACRVEIHVVGHDQMRVGADPQVADGDALALQPLELVDQDLRVDDDAVADDARRPRVQDAGRDQVQLELLGAANDRVAGVVAALEAHDEVGLLGEQVGDLSLSFIAPLGAHDHEPGH